MTEVKNPESSAATENQSDAYTRDPYGAYSDEAHQPSAAHRAGQPEPGVIDGELSVQAAAARTPEGEPLAATELLRGRS